MADVLIHLKTKLDAKGIDKFRQSLKDLDSKVIGGVKAGIAGVGTAAAVAFGVTATESLKFADEAAIAMKEFGNQTDTSEAALGEFKDVAFDLFAAGVGEDIGDVARAMAEVNKQTGLTGDELEKATRKASFFERRFDADVNETIRAANQLVKTGLAKNFDEAFDIIGAGLTSGANAGDDLLDTFNEYATTFQELGFDGEQALASINSGLEAGFENSDRIADSWREFGIRLRDPATLEKITELGPAFADVIEGFNSGSIDAAEAMTMIQSGLAEIEDPLQRQEIAVALLGTKYEDYGQTAFMALSATTEGLGNIEGAADRAAQSGIGLGEQWDIAMRQLMVGLEPAAQEMMPLLVDGIKSVGDFVVAAQPIFSEFATNLKGTVGPAMALISDAAVRIGVAFGITEEGATGLDTALAVLKGGLDVIVTGLEAVAIASQGLAFIIEQTKEAIELVGSLSGQYGQILGSGASLRQIYGSGARAVGIPGFADGVTNFSGGLAVVGEQGPELVNLPGGSDVIPNGGIDTGQLQEIVAEVITGAMAKVAQGTISEYHEFLAGQLD